jgi:hypothetical protein
MPQARYRHIPLAVTLPVMQDRTPLRHLAAAVGACCSTGYLSTSSWYPRTRVCRESSASRRGKPLCSKVQVTTLLEGAGYPSALRCRLPLCSKVQVNHSLSWGHSVISQMLTAVLVLVQDAYAYVDDNIWFLKSWGLAPHDAALKGDVQPDRGGNRNRATLQCEHSGMHACSYVLGSRNELWSALPLNMECSP